MVKKAKIEIIFEDDHFLIVNKPSGVLTIPDRFMQDRLNLRTMLTEKYENIYVVHRLDKDTSGIICFAKTGDAHKNLSRQFSEKTAEKFYYALVDGRMYQPTGEIDKPLVESSVRAGKMLINKRGKASLTLFKAIEYFDHFTLVECQIMTGRMHQIRVHLESIGHPLAIDALYGRRSEFFLSSVKRKKYNKGKHEEERPLMSRSTLHARKLVLDHPSTGERMTFEAELHKDFSAMLKQLRKWGAKKS